MFIILVFINKNEETAIDQMLGRKTRTILKNRSKSVNREGTMPAG